MLLRLSLGGIGLFQTGVGLFMILAPAQWFMDTPGVADTGPFNAHFVVDVGLGFLAAGLSCLLCVWHPRLKPVGLGASGFVVFHALFHLSHLVMGRSTAPRADVALALVAFLGLVLTWPGREVRL